MPHFVYPVWRWLGLGLLALLQGCGATLLRTSCEEPRISNFGAPSSYIVILPLRYAGQSPALAEAALQLNQITRLQALQASVEMPDTQITLVEGQPGNPRCGIEPVYDRVVDSRRKLFWRRPFHSAVFVWGELYDHGDGLLIQSHLRVFWNGSADRELELSVDAPSLVRPLRFGADLPTDTISFAPLVLPRAEQQRLAQAIASGLQVRSEPRLDAPALALPARFSAVAWRRPWLELHDREGQAYWLLIDERQLAGLRLLPETAFARGVAAYLNARVDGDAESRAQALKAMARFRDAVPAQDQAAMKVPLAMAAMLEGSLGLPVRSDGYAAGAPPSAKAVDAAAKAALGEAVRRLPDNGELLNLSALARIPGCCEGSQPGPALLEILGLFERAAALEPGHRKIAENLFNWTVYMASFSDDRLTMPRTELLQRSQLAEQSWRAWRDLAVE